MDTDTVASVLVFSGIILANFYCAAVLIMLRRRKRGNNGQTRGSRRPQARRFKLPPFLKLWLKKMVQPYYWLRPSYKADIFPTAVLVGEMRSFAPKYSGAH